MRRGAELDPPMLVPVRPPSRNASARRVFTRRARAFALRSVVTRRPSSRRGSGPVSYTHLGNEVIVTRPNDAKENRSLHGLTRTLIHNMVVGVTDGFKKELDVNGVGYRVACLLYTSGSMK